jgi:putative inorganic carbon (HCO3(-)) transporter
MWTELWVVAAAVLAGMIWQTALVAAPIIWLAYALLRLIVERRLPGPTPADLSILLLVLLLPLNYAFAAIPGRTLPAILRLLGGIGLFYALVNWCQTTLRLRWLAAFTALAGLALSLLSLVSVTWTSGKLLFIPSSIYERFSLYAGDTIHPNVMGGSLIAVLPLILAVPLFAWRKCTWAERLFYPTILIVTLGALVLTQSRGALLALMATLIIMLLLRSAWFWALPILGFLVIVTTVIMLGPLTIQSYLVDLISIEGFGQRADIWQHTIYMLQDFSLTGVGLGHYSDAFQIFYPMSLDPTSTMPHAHNIFLQVGADLGIPGLVIWLSVLLAGLAAGWQVYRVGKRLGQPMLSAIGVGLLGCQLAITLHGLLDSVLWGEIRIAPLVWWLWGLTMAANNLVGRLILANPAQTGLVSPEPRTALFSRLRDRTTHTP